MMMEQGRHDGYGFVHTYMCIEEGYIMSMEHSLYILDGTYIYIDR